MRCVVLILLLLAPSAVLLDRGVAEAGPNDWGYIGGSHPIRAPDSRDHWACKNGSVNLGERAHLDAALDQLASQTVMTAHQSSTCGSATDVVWIATGQDGIDGALGRAVCVKHASWGVCEQFWVFYDPAMHFLAAFDQCSSDQCVADSYRLNLILTYRHELGHTAGLHHYVGLLSRPYGTMNSSWLPRGHPDWLWYLVYGDIHALLIDAHM